MNKRCFSLCNLCPYDLWETKNKPKDALVSPYPPVVSAVRGIISRTFRATWPRAPAASCCSPAGPPCASTPSSACSRWRSSRGHVTPAPRSSAWNTPPTVSWTPCIWKKGRLHFWRYIHKSSTNIDTEWGNKSLWKHIKHAKTTCLFGT